MPKTRSRAAWGDDSSGQFCSPRSLVGMLTPAQRWTGGRSRLTRRCRSILGSRAHPQQPLRHFATDFRGCRDGRHPHSWAPSRTFVAKTIIFRSIESR